MATHNEGRVTLRSAASGFATAWTVWAGEEQIGGEYTDAFDAETAGLGVFVERMKAATPLQKILIEEQVLEFLKTFCRPSWRAEVSACAGL